MKILHTLDSLNRGGKEMLALDLCRNAKINGLEMVFVATGGGDLEDAFKNSDVEFIRLKRKLPVDPFIIWHLISIINKKGINIIHAHGAVEGFHSYLASKWTRAKVVLSYHGYIPQAQKDNKILKYLSSKVDVNIAVSKGFIARLKKQSNIKNLDDFHVIYNGIDIKKFINGFDGNKNIREELELEDNVFLAGMVGNFQAGKDHFTICKAMPSIVKEIPNFHFVFVGDKVNKTPEYYDNCYIFCKEHNLLSNVHFLGKRDDVPSILKDLDLFVFSTIEDTFGIAVVEAMLLGIPTLSSDILPLLEVTDNGKYGMLFKTSDEKDLSDKIIYFLNNREELKEIGKSGKDWAMEKFSIENYIDELKRLYGELLI